MNLSKYFAEEYWWNFEFIFSFQFLIIKVGKFIKLSEFIEELKQIIFRSKPKFLP